MWNPGSSIIPDLSSGGPDVVWFALSTPPLSDVTEGFGLPWSWACLFGSTSSPSTVSPRTQPLAPSPLFLMSSLEGGALRVCQFSFYFVSKLYASFHKPEIIVSDEILQPWACDLHFTSRSTASDLHSFLRISGGRLFYLFYVWGEK